MNSNENHSGIYLLPNLLTTASLFAAFYSLVASLKHQFETAIIAIFIGMIADALDGRIARMTNTQTAFGAEYDSLSDMVTAGVAPALLLYSWALNQLGKVGWLISFLYTAAVALRLARFNIHVATSDKRYFYGLPSPAGAGIVASFAWLFQTESPVSMLVASIAGFITFIAAILMVSNIRYYSFKDIDFKGKVPFLYVLISLITLVLVAADPSLILFIATSTYAFSGVFLTIKMLQRGRFRRKK